ncbi:MAG TPA: N-acetylmuramoyl-L-alanine amidase family protein [bacterium]|nr:N-acetylmuramoyl-L-alanine amidase family protein [bacterium]
MQHSTPHHRGQIIEHHSRRRGLLVSVLLSLAVLGAGVSPTPAQPVPLRIIANGEDLASAGDAIVQDGVVMAPLPGLFEPLGIHATWDGRARVLTLQSPAGDEMELRTNDPYATVNGERRPVPVPLVTVLGRVLVPAQWVFDTLGDVTIYDAGQRTLFVNGQITAVSWRATDAGLEVTLEATAPLHPRITTLHTPERLVVDVPGAVARTPQPLTDVHEGPLQTIRMGQAAGGARVVFDLTGPVRYRLLSAPADRHVVIALGGGAAPGPIPAGPSGRKLLDVAYEPADGGGRVVITATQPIRAAEHVLRGPDRIVLDVADAVFVPVKKALDVNDGLVVQVRAAQFHKDPNIVRIVVELSRPAPYAVHPGADPSQLVIDLGGAAQPPAAGGHGRLVVAIDAGHGGSDPGAIGPSGVLEKDVALAIAQDLRTLLVRQRIDVVMVRDADVFVPLEDRARIAARGGATLFVSIHANAAVDANANGTQAFYLTPQSAPLASAIADEIGRAAGVGSRGIAVARFAVLVGNPHIPAVLVETAFVTNPREEQLLRVPAGQQAFAQGILKGLQRYAAAPAAEQP